MATDKEKIDVISDANEPLQHVPFTIPRKPICAVTVTPIHDQVPASGTIKSAPSRISKLSLLWHRSTRRARAIAISIVVAFFVLIIGLAAGLSTRATALSNLPLPSEFGGPYTGDLTYYAPGLGACGVTSSISDKIVAVSHFLFDSVQTGSDPNSNPLCGKRVRVKVKGSDTTIDLTVVDRCTGCEPNDLDVTEDTFSDLADVSLGRVLCEWSWIDAHA